jgi:hypothetical protein
MKKFGRFVATALLGLTGILGLMNGARELDTGLTGLQRSVSYAVLIYGVFGVVAAIGMVRRSPWVVSMVAVWTLASMWAGSVASFAFHDPGLEQPGTLVGVIASAAVILLIGAFVAWMARDAMRVSSPQSPGNIHAP